MEKADPSALGLRRRSPRVGMTRSLPVPHGAVEFAVDGQVGAFVGEFGGEGFVEVDAVAGLVSRVEHAVTEGVGVREDFVSFFGVGHVLLNAEVGDGGVEVQRGAHGDGRKVGGAVAAHLERSIMQIAVSQLILNSKLAQYASRFRAMSASHQRADESKQELHLAFNRARRGIKDERLKESINGIKKSKAGAAV